MKSEFEHILSEIEGIIAKIAKYGLSDVERNHLDKLFRLKLKQAQLLKNKKELKLVG